VEAGDRVPAEYDNLIAKVMVVASDRDTAIHRLARALAETEIGGIQTTLPFHRFVAASPAFRDAHQLSTAWVAQHWDGPVARRRAASAAALGAAIWTIEGQATQSMSTSTAVPGRDDWREAARVEGVARWPGRPRG
jgi:acetyl/propionyl-CoA carboxylase alpha subunit